MSNNLNAHIDKMVILPSTFIGLQRNIMQIIKMQWQLLVNLVNQIFLLQ